MKQYSLSELCQNIEEVLAEEFASTYWVRAEVASLSVRGHCYMELVEKASTKNIAAKVRATCWQQMYGILSPYFEAETGQKISVGMQVLLEVEMSFHAVYGLSLNIVGIDPTFTLGDMARQRQETIQRLKDDGVMDMQSSLEIPSLPRRIAVISSADAAGYGDFCHQLENNSGGFQFRTQLFAAIMQGDQSAKSIIQSLQQIADEIDKWDIVVIVRGGGASTDLRNFDDYELASHCAQFPLPIIAGIGHTRDISIVDMVVHSSVKTPTAAAEWLINAMQQQADRIAELYTRLQRAIQHTINQQHIRIEQLQQALQYASKKHLYQLRSQLEMWQKTIELHSPERIYRMGYSLTTVDGKVVKSIHDVKAGQQLQTHTADGTITSVVEE